MSFLHRIRELFSPSPKSPDEIEAEREAARVEDQNVDVRLAQRSPAGNIYQSGRGTK